MEEFADDPEPEVMDEPAGGGGVIADAGNDAAGDAGANDGGAANNDSMLLWVINSLGWGYLLIFLALSVTSGIAVRDEYAGGTS